MVRDNPETFADLDGHAGSVGQEVLLQGWVYNIRTSGKILFPLFRDGTGIIQGVVVKSAVPVEVFERVQQRRR
jgi:asparaginyl-tRNA synthetase